MITPINNLTRTLVCLVTLLAAHVASAFYDPTLQRWLNRDPVGEAGGVNLYRFVENGPVGGYDPDGRILGQPILPRRERSSCVFWDNRKTDPNTCTAAYAAAAAVVCRLAGESPWEQCQRACLQITYTTFGQDCCSVASAARFAALTAARYAACAAACVVDAGPPRPPPFPPPL